MDFGKTTYSSQNAGKYVEETMVAESSGTLFGFTNIGLYSTGSPADMATLDFCSYQAGPECCATVLGSCSYAVGGSWNYDGCRFSGGGVAVTSGTTYTLRLGRTGSLSNTQYYHNNQNTNRQADDYCYVVSSDMSTVSNCLSSTAGYFDVMRTADYTAPCSIENSAQPGISATSTPGTNTISYSGNAVLRGSFCPGETYMGSSYVKLYPPNYFTNPYIYPSIGAGAFPTQDAVFTWNCAGTIVQRYANQCYFVFESGQSPHIVDSCNPGGCTLTSWSAAGDVVNSASGSFDSAYDSIQSSRNFINGLWTIVFEERTSLGVRSATATVTVSQAGNTSTTGNPVQSGTTTGTIPSVVFTPITGCLTDLNPMSCFVTLALGQLFNVAPISWIGQIKTALADSGTATLNLDIHDTSGTIGFDVPLITSGTDAGIAAAANSLWPGWRTWQEAGVYLALLIYCVALAFRLPALI